MTDQITPQHISRANRRLAALALHSARNDHLGMQVIVNETFEADETELLLSASANAIVEMLREVHGVNTEAVLTDRMRQAFAAEVTG